MGEYLSKPDRNKDIEVGENDRLRFVACGMQGWRRSMEDSHIAEKDLGEDVALMNARLAKILTKDYYDDKRRVPILWSPETDNNTDSGTGSSNEGTV